MNGINDTVQEWFNYCINQFKFISHKLIPLNKQKNKLKTQKNKKCFHCDNDAKCILCFGINYNENVCLDCANNLWNKWKNSVISGNTIWVQLPIHKNINRFSPKHNYVLSLENEIKVRDICSKYNFNYKLINNILNIECTVKDFDDDTLEDLSEELLPYNIYIYVGDKD